MVGIDQGAEPPPGLAARLGVTFAAAEGRSQAAAINAAAMRIGGDYVAVLEDDDRWNGEFLTHALKALQDFDFVSSTQLEVDNNREVLRINDFATPSGWVMRRSVWDSVGPFNTQYRWHLDNEWLGRLGQSGARRLHFIEATAPIDHKIAEQARPWLANFAAGGVVLARHNSPWPFVIRLCHPGSGAQQILRDPQLGAQSRKEIEQIVARFGCIPW